MLLSNHNMSRVILAYEPIWAIGTGETASPNQIEEVHAYIRGIIVEKIGPSSGKKIPILYGGSCTSQNSKSILNKKNVNGLLIGGASLDFVHFQKIIKIANELS